MISSHPPTVRRQLLSNHFLIATMPKGALDDLVEFATIARFEPHRVIFSKGDAGDCLYATLLAFPVRLTKRLLDPAEHYRRPHEHEVTVQLSQHDLGC